MHARTLGLALLVLPISAQSVADAPRYTAQRLRGPDGEMVFPFAMGPTGIVAANLLRPGPRFDLAFWNGEWSTHPNPYDSLGIGGVNRHGEFAAVGGRNGSTPRRTIFKGDAQGITELFTPEAWYVGVGGINARGTITFSYDPRGGGPMVAYTIDGDVLTRLESPEPGMHVWAGGINDLGEVAGSGPAVWRDGRVIRRPRVPEGFRWGHASQINNAGVAIGGASNDPYGGNTPVVWIGDEPRVLPVLGAYGTRAQWINNSGLIVGSYVDPALPYRPGVVWIDGAIFDLASLIDSPTIRALEPIGVDDAGRILATSPAYYETVVWILTPIPAPSAALPVALAALLVACRRR